MQGHFSDSDFYSGPLQTMKYQGKTYSIPVGNNDLALFYNMKAFKDANLTPPATWDDLVKDAKLLTKGNTYGFAFSAPANEQATFSSRPSSGPTRAISQRSARLRVCRLCNF